MRAEGIVCTTDGVFAQVSAAVGSDESTTWPILLRDLDLGAPRNHRAYIPRGGTRLCRASFRRRYRLATRPRHLQSVKAHRPNRDDSAPGVAGSPTFAVFIWLCKAGSSQLPGAAQS